MTESSASDNSNPPNEPEALGAELAFLQKNIHYSNVERRILLGFAVTATIAILRNVLSSDTESPESNILALAVLSELVIFGALVLTIRSTLGAMRDGAYIRIFLEDELSPHYETRLHKYEKGSKKYAKYLLSFGTIYGLLLLTPPASVYLVYKKCSITWILVVLLSLAALNLILAVCLIKKSHDELMRINPSEKWHNVKTEERKSQQNTE